MKPPNNSFFFNHHQLFSKYFPFHKLFPQCLHPRAIISDREQQAPPKVSFKQSNFRQIIGYDVSITVAVFDYVQ